jgi:hypothetical protein
MLHLLAHQCVPSGSIAVCCHRKSSKITRRQMALLPICVCEVVYLRLECTDTDIGTHDLILIGLHT